MALIPFSTTVSDPNPRESLLLQPEIYLSADVRNDCVASFLCVADDGRGPPCHDVSDNIRRKVDWRVEGGGARKSQRTALKHKLKSVAQKTEKRVNLEACLPRIVAILHFMVTC